MKVIGSAIFDWGLYPEWLKNGNFTNEELEQIVRERVRSVMEPYKGEVGAWVVVNEFKSSWGISHDYLYKKLGNKVLDIAYSEARKTDPEAVLIFNDSQNQFFSRNDLQGTLEKDVKIIRRLKQQNLVDAIGIQMHLNQNEWQPIPSPDEFAKVLQVFKDLGVEIRITEMDVNLGKTGTKWDKYTQNPDERFLFQGQVYRDVLKTYLEANVGNVFVFWDLTDDSSWFNWLGIPDADATMFDRNHNPKPAYFALLQVLYEMAKQGYHLQLEN
jgi:endo-1,4-beta-xylanase